VLAGKAQGRAARDEDVDVRRQVQQGRHVLGRIAEMLEVVEEEQRSRPGELLGDALDERSTRGLSDAEDVGDGRRHECGVRHGGEADQVDRPLERSECRDLQGEPALSGATRAGDRDEPDVGPCEQGERRGQVLPPSHEAVVERWERRPSERSQRSESFLQAGRHELEELLGGRDVLQPMASERAERHARVGVVSEEVARRA
jgi:hypothetical protein